MAGSNENELIKSLIWSKREYSLAEFIEEYPLPQVVCVVDGYYSENEETSFGADQVLALHDILSTPKVIGTDCFGKPVAIPLACSTKAEVCPFNCKYINCKVEDLKSVYPEVEYVRVKTSGKEETTDGDESLCVGDLLQITKIDRKRKLVLCKNLETKQDISLTYTCPAIFTPLLDYRRYTIADIKANYGFPTRVRFVNEIGDVRSRRSSAISRGSRTGLSNLGEIVLFKEATETSVIATTVGGGLGDKRCMGLPKDLPVNFAVAEGFTKGGGNYEKVVRTLHAGFKVTNLADFDQLNICQHMNAVRTYEYTTADTLAIVSRPLPESDRQFPMSKKGPLPTLPVRRHPTFGKHDAPVSPPVSVKPFRKQSLNNPKPSSRENVYTNSRNPAEILRKSTLTSEFLGKQPRSKISHFPTRSVGENSNEKELTEDQYTYIEMEGLINASIYEPADFKENHGKVYAQTGGISSRRTQEIPKYEIPSTKIICPDEYAQKNPNFETQKRSSEISIGSQKESMPTSSHTFSDNLSELRCLLSDETEDIYKRIALIPEDLSDLTVDDVGHVLKCLRMEGYVKTFEEEMIDGPILKDLDLGSLENLNVTLFHGKKLIKFINGWRPRKGQQK